MEPKELRILNAIYDRLAVIEIANNYNTDIGLQRFRGKVDMTERDIEQYGAVVSVAEDIEFGVLDQDNDCLDIALAQYIIIGGGKCDPDHPSGAAHRIIADIKQAVLLPDDRKIGGLVNDLSYIERFIDRRSAGSGVIAAGITVLANFAENYGDPYT